MNLLALIIAVTVTHLVSYYIFAKDTSVSTIDEVNSKLNSSRILSRYAIKYSLLFFVMFLDYRIFILTAISYYVIESVTLRIYASEYADKDTLKFKKCYHVGTTLAHIGAVLGIYALVNSI